MNKLNAITKKTNGGLVIMVLLNWFSKSRGMLKFKYDVIDTNWVDVDFIMSIINMNYEKEKYIYWLNCFDAITLDEFVINKIL